MPSVANVPEGLYLLKSMTYIIERGNKTKYKTIYIIIGVAVYLYRKLFLRSVIYTSLFVTNHDRYKSKMKQNKINNI